MPLYVRFLILACLAFMTCACGSDDDSSTVHGTVSFAEAVVPQPTWRVEVKLLDVSFADAPSIEVGSFVQDSPSEVPIKYQIAYPASGIEERKSYTVSAEILDVGNPTQPVLLFLSTQSYPVLTGGHGSEANIIVERAN